MDSMVVIKKVGRAKIPITWIKRDASRHVTFTKRKKGLKKKVEELAILCGVEVCMICFAPQADKPSSGAPYSWGLPGVSHVINKYRSLSKEEQDKKKLDNTSLLEQQIKKLKSELKLKMEQNRDLENQRACFLWDDRLNAYDVDDLRQLADMVLDQTRAVYEKIAYVSQRQQDVLQGFGNALEQRSSAFDDGNNGNNAMENIDMLASSQLNHELMMSSQAAGPYQQLVADPYKESEENPSSSFGDMMNANAQSYQHGLMNQISLLGLPAYIDEQKANMPLDNGDTSASGNFYLNVNTMLPLSADASFAPNQTLSLRVKEQEQLTKPPHVVSDMVHPAFLKTKIHELMESHMASNVIWRQAVSLQPDHPRQFAPVYPGSPSSQQASEHHAEELVDNGGAGGGNLNNMAERGAYDASMQKVNVQLCQASGMSSGRSVCVGNTQFGTSAMNGSILQLEPVEGPVPHNDVLKAREEGGMREGTLIWNLEDEPDKMSSVYHSHMLAEDGEACLDKGLTALESSSVEEDNDAIRHDLGGQMG